MSTESLVERLAARMAELGRVTGICTGTQGSGVYGLSHKGGGMSRVLRSGLATVALLLSLLLVPALAGAAPAPMPTPPPTLTGELLAGRSLNADNSFRCNGTGPLATDIGGTFSFAATGVAVGPYSGPFTETGRASITPDGTLTAFTAAFTIDSPLGQVTGTKTLTGGTGSCLFGQIVLANAQTTYRATITTPDGFAYTDSGTSVTHVDIGHPRTQTTNLNETFVSTQLATIPVPPTSADQCKGGGHTRFIDPSTGASFANQGQCIQFVNTGK